MKTHLVLHHSATKDGDSLSWPILRKNHLALGWPDVAYHLGIERVKRSGTESHYEMLVGRPLTARAAGAWQEGFNTKGVHVCFVGNYDLAAPPPDMWAFAMPHLAALIDVLGIPLENVIGHRDIADVATYKKCPGALWPMDRFRTMLGGQP